MIAVLAVPYGPEAKSDSRPDTLEIAMIDAASLRSRCGRAARTRRTVCMRSTFRLARQFSSVSGIASALTFATTTSIPPSDSADLSTHAASACSSPTSATVPVTLPRPLRSSWVALTSSGLRAQKATTAPSSRKPSTTARPMPRVPPVTRTRVPLSCRSIDETFPLLAEGTGARTQVVVHPVEGFDGGEQVLGRLHHHAVVGIDDVGDRHFRDLRAQLVGVHPMQAVQLADPVHELGVPDTPGVLHRSAGADGHPVRVVLDPRPTGPVSLDELHDDRCGHGAFDGRSARFSLPLAVVPVADREERSLDIDTEERRRTSAHLRTVHVAADTVTHPGC